MAKSIDKHNMSIWFFVDCYLTFIQFFAKM
jgi:hypothetical protein